MRAFGLSALGAGLLALGIYVLTYQSPQMSESVVMYKTRNLNVCGDGNVADAEACDDGNIAASDGCSATCTVEAGWACTGSPSICSDDPTLFAPLQTDLDDDVAGATVNYTRATAATRTVWANCATTPVATLSTIASGNPRFNTLCAGSSAVTGLLVEPAATNLVLQSQTFDTTWVTTRVTVEADQVVAPDGTLTADYLREDGSAETTHHLSQNTTCASGTICIFSVYAKAGTRSWLYLSANQTTAASSYFNVATCAVGTQSNSVGSAKQIGGGWCRVELRWTSDLSSAVTKFFYLAEGNGDVVFSGVNEADSIALWGAQVEVAPASGLPSSYVPTTTDAATRNADVLYYSKAAPAAGSLYLSVLCPSTDLAADVAFATYSDGTADNRITLQGLAAGDVAKLVITTGTTEQAAVTGTTDLYDGALHTLRAVWDSSGAALYVDDVSEGTPDTNGVSVPTTTRLYLASGTGTLQSGCIIAPLKDYDEVVAP